MEDEDGNRRQAFVDDLTQPQHLFLFHAEEKRRALRHGEDGNQAKKMQDGGMGGGGSQGKTYHLG